MKSNFQHRLFLLVFSIFCLQVSFAQESLVKDINPGPGWASIDFKFRIGEQFYFIANSDLGRELWVSNGTPDGTVALKDINPIIGVGSEPSEFVQLNDIWYFVADDGTNGNELWRTDGTTDGTLLVKDILPGLSGADPNNLVVINGLIYFSANDGDTGQELWVSDGTEMNTTLVADINPGVTSSSPANMVALGSEIVFTAAGSTIGNELWKTDGTSIGTVLIKDINLGTNSSFASDLTVVSDKVYFLADDGISGKELWRTDGTNAGTIFTNNIVAGGGNPQARDLHAVGDFLFMVADNGANGEEIYRSDASAIVPTVEMLEIFADSFASEPKDFIYLNDDLMFNANNSGVGYELWKANASNGSIEMVKDIFPGFGSSSPVMLAVLNDDLIFRARGETIGFEIWKTDGTESGTVLLGDLNTDPNTTISSSDPTLPFVKDNVLYFTATDYINGYQIWRTDGTTSSTQRLTDIPHDTIFNNTHKPYFINNIGNTVINFVGLGDPYGEELWKQDVDPIAISNVETNSPLTCNGDTDGTITISISGGVGDPSCFAYQWSDPTISGLSASNLSAGSYTLTVTDCVGFNTITTIDIEEADLVIGMTTEDSPVSCNGGSDGQATVTGFGGSGTFTYLWDNNEITATATALNVGIHTVTITDNNDCVGTATINITEPSAVTAAAFGGTTICDGANNGSATAAGFGGNPDYTFLWDNGETTVTAINLAAGLHTVTVTDANGCTATETEMINAYPAVSITFNNSDVSCINGANGSTTALPSGGTGSGYTYLWQGGASTATISDLAPGTYQVTIMDDNGCSAISSTTILQPIIAAASSSPVSCFGGSDGSATISITNPNSTYTYLWDNGETAATANMLDAGNHSVTVTDLLNCSSVVDIMILEAPDFVFADSLVFAPNCFGETNGFITYNFAGGTGPYQYDWSTGQTTSTGTLAGLSGGSYCVTVTDLNNCKTFNFCTVLEEPAEITSSVMSSTDATCFDICNGAATVNISGGEPGANYTFTWPSGETNTGVSTTATELCAGMNTVTITDGTCTVERSVMINQPAQIIATISTNAVSCFGASDGSVSATAIGGMGNLTYEFSGGDSDLAAGSYFLSVTDANGCMGVQSFNIGTPDVISVSYDITSPTCIGEADGSVLVSAQGGTGAYTFEYSDSTTNLLAGEYSVTVTDENNCSVIDTYTIVDPAAIVITTNVTSVSCNGLSDGAVDVATSGGTGDIELVFEVGPQGLSAGEYDVTAIDANGCSAIATFEVTQPTELIGTVAMLQNVSCNGANDGSVEFEASGGTPPYSFFGEEDLEPGNYTFFVSDANGCEAPVSFEITEPDVLAGTTSSTNALDNNADGTATAEPSGGTAPYSYAWNTTPVQTTQMASDLTAGDYSVTVTDANNCTVVLMVTVDMTVNINELDESLRFELFPNPATKNTVVDFEFEQNETVDLMIFDVLGRTMYFKSLRNVREEQVEINLETFAQGVYWIRLKNKQGQYVRKLTIVK